MKAYVKVVLTVMLLAAFFLLSGFRTQTIIHDDGSETQDVLKVSDTETEQQKLKEDANDFQKRSFTIMDYSNENGSGFRAMKTITEAGANKSSIDHVVHKTHDGLFSSTYYIDYNFDSDSLQNLRLGEAMPENGVDLEYIISFPAGTQVTSNSDQADDQGSTYLWQLSADNPREITLQATVWHKLFIYLALFLVILILLVVLFIEHRRKKVISWKKAAHMRRVEIILLFIPLAILAYMGYEYYIGTHITSASLDKVAEQQQEELIESREEDRRLQNDSKKAGGMANQIRNKAREITQQLRDLEKQYNEGTIDRDSARLEAQNLAQQAADMLDEENGLSQADRDVLQQLINSVVEEAESIGLEPPTEQVEERSQESSREEERTQENEQTQRREKSSEEDVKSTPETTTDERDEERDNTAQTEDDTGAEENSETENQSDK